MTRNRWILIGSSAAALGGLSWLVKAAVIIATDGRVTDEGAAAVFYILGVALLVLGSTAIGVLLAGDRPRPLLAALVVISPIFVFASYAVLDGIAKPLVENRGPAYWRDEAGIVATALVWLLLGICMITYQAQEGWSRSRPADAKTG